MKNLILFLFLIPLTLSAGEIINRKTGDQLQIEYDPSAREVTITLKTATKEEHWTRSVEEFREKNKTGIVTARNAPTEYYRRCFGCSPYAGNPQEIFRNSHDWYDNAKENFKHIAIGYFVLGYNLVLIGANAYDVAVLPIRLTRKILRDINVKRDIILINNTINSIGSVEVSSRQFQRLFYYL